jgi:transcriptional regulator with GAF, ATPase, and Fis domain
MITGESGVGKEVVARLIHNRGLRAKERFVAVNCAAISPNLVESELFGHEKGAFTGADRRKVGKFEYADGGTLFLDEVGDLPLEAQAKLLRALQDRVIERVGGVENIKIDIRVICATNRDLAMLVREGQFRPDLYYRLSVFPIHVPSLRERREAILALAEFFIKRFTGGRRHLEMLTEGAQNALLKHLWPGNVRELANAMERAVILAGRDGRITADILSFLQNPAHEPPVSSSQSGPLIQLPPEGISLEEVEQELIRQALQMAGNNQSAAARLLGLTRSKLRSRLKEL